MKSRLLAIVLGMSLIGFSGCPGSTEKSSENRIESFTVGTVSYQVTDAGITYLYEKASENTWTGRPSTWPSITPTIVLKDQKNASVSPTSGAQVTLTSSGSDTYTTTYTVTAQDGTPKTYTVTVTLGAL